jgi:hypothetical protein
VNGDIPKLTNQENNFLITDFTEKEVHEAIMQMEKNKAPGPDGFPAEFYQSFWEIFKHDLLALFADFKQGRLPLHKLNFGNIILLPKKRECNSDPAIPPNMLTKCQF